MDSTRLDPFEYSVYKKIEEALKGQAIEGETWLVAVSGGLDSMVLVHLLLRFQSRLKTRLQVAAIHHGVSQNSQTIAYRDESISLAKGLCERLQLPFHSNLDQPLRELNTEEEFRDFRRTQLLKIKKTISADRIVLAHHWDDLLETRMIRLIRGCGPGGLKAMKVLSDEWFRPLLGVRRGELEDYAKKESIEFAEDPSNDDEQFLRNFIRKNWLRQLENYRPGASQAIARSLQSLSDAIDEAEPESAIDSKDSSLKLPHWYALSTQGQVRELSRLLLQHGVEKFTLGQLQEAQKRLNAMHGSGVFQLVGLSWKINAGRVELTPL